MVALIWFELSSALSFTFQRLRTRPIGTDESIGEFRGTLPINHFSRAFVVLNQILISGNEKKFWADLDLCVLCITNVVVVFLSYRLK